MRNVIFSVVLAAMVSACAGTQVRENPESEAVSPAMAAPSSATSVRSSTAESVSTIPVPPETGKSSINPLKDPASLLSKRNIYFDFDTYEVKSEYRVLIEAHARYLADYSSVRIRLEGNADDRGSREYNLALGQKRAAAVKSVMHVLGVPDNRIETVSYGEEKPKAMGHDEASWAENRRADIVYPGE